jgi:hypothetical protein
MRPLIGQCLAGIAKAWEAAGEVATAADYSEQAQHTFDELRQPSNPSHGQHLMTCFRVAPRGSATCNLCFGGDLLTTGS